ncbi:sigma-70 family RNA polymerase sigma factor [Rhizobium laguerreae]|uniref:sigma-70 family RNA polymerase sigma factor n=1 Tax=Rhizobium laguerreae TaxID=1076926 RepID=UPI001C906E10|nr:sigma-70 family RNA polymerase sigma factor [Rhizobium laguerreae]MBY3543636.1 sigma-70 family RNA polymerase sigma factor [Rhizobium laguerreae]
MAHAINAPADTRPAEFDARLMNYFPHLRRLAGRLSNNKTEQEDLFQDSIAYVLSHWTSFRPDGGFYNWITLCMRHVAQNGRRKSQLRSRHMPTVSDERAMAAVMTPPNQTDAVALNETLAALDPGRSGDVVMMRAMGETLDVIGTKYGIGKERVRQIEEKERNRLRAA